MELDCVILIVFFTDTATTEIYTYGHTLSLHDALPILARLRKRAKGAKPLCPVSENDRLRTSSISAQGLQWLTTNNLPNDWSRNASATALWRAYSAFLRVIGVLKSLVRSNGSSHFLTGSRMRVSLTGILR